MTAKFKYPTDAPNYQGIDGGCLLASLYLDEPSCCLNCPFPEKCVYQLSKRKIHRLIYFLHHHLPFKLSDFMLEVKKRGV